MRAKQVRNLIMLFTLIFVAGSFANAGEVLAVGFGTSRETPQYWIDKLAAPDDIIMPEKEIEAYNRQVQRKLSDGVFDLRQYPSQLDRQTLTNFLGNNELPREEMYSNGVPVTADFYNSIKEQMNLQQVQDINTVRYGFAVKRTNIRTFPTSSGIYQSANDHEFDMFQETAINPAEPLLILHKSLQGDWFFVQTYNYRGWVPANNVAVAASRDEWLYYMNTASFLVVTGSKLQVTATRVDKEPLIFEMGAKLPLADTKDKPMNGFVIKLPVRDRNGGLCFEETIIPRSADVNIGYLPYTRANIIRQAFKFLGQPYGWGGLKDSVDCSSLTMDVYRSFGFNLPRNADQQEVDVGRVVRLSDNAAKREEQLKSLQAGATLHMNGHVMLLLGQDEGKYYIIHSLGSYGDKNTPNSDGTLKRVEVMQVVVTNLDISRRNGKTFKESLTVAKNINW